MRDDLKCTECQDNHITRTHEVTEMALTIETVCERDVSIINENTNDERLSIERKMMYKTQATPWLHVFYLELTCNVTILSVRSG